jgi:hypothetical protein
MQPESSDGFASVGTILPKEKAALLPGGFFLFLGSFLLLEAGVEWDEFVAKFRFVDAPIINSDGRADIRDADSGSSARSKLRSSKCMILCWRSSLLQC